MFHISFVWYRIFPHGHGYDPVTNVFEKFTFSQGPSAPAVTLEPMQCPENDDLISAFDKMMSETYSDRDTRSATAPVALPMPTRVTQKKSYGRNLILVLSVINGKFYVRRPDSLRFS